MSCLAYTAYCCHCFIHDLRIKIRQFHVIPDLQVIIIKKKKKKNQIWTSLVVQWLRILLPTQGIWV